MLDFPLVAAQQKLSVRTIFWKPPLPNGGGDIALLRLKAPPPDGAKAAHIVVTEDQWGHDFRVFGFPDYQGVWASGKLRAREASGWVQIEDVKEAGYRVQTGFSGAPVWDEQLKGVAGMVVAAERDATIRAAYMIPAAELLKAYQQLGQQTTPYKRRESFHKYHNLPSREGAFFGRKADKDRVLKGLASEWPVVTIEGIGGVGKTTLALETANYCLQDADQLLNQQFDVVVWVSAKERLEQKQWLNEILDQIAYVLDYPNDAALSPNPSKQKQTKVSERLQTRRTLVVVDNFETIEDPDLVAWLRQVPKPTKVLITSRRAQLRGPGDHPWVVPLKGLSEDEALELIHSHAERLELDKTLVADEGDLRDLIHVTAGNPQAIAMALGYLEKGDLKLKVIVKDLQTAGQSVEALFDYLFERDWIALKSYPDAQHLLLAMTFFKGPVSRETLGATDGTVEDNFSKSVRQLESMSLLEVDRGLKRENPHYSIHPLTRAFASKRLFEVHQWQQEARERWVKWYLDFTKEIGGFDWERWTPHYDAIEKEWDNLLAVFAWCADNDRYDELKAFWSKDRLRSFSDRYWHWKERLTYFDWLISEAQKREDWLAALDAMEAKSWTLILIGQPDRLVEADNILEQAYKLRDRVDANDAAEILYHLINDITSLKLRQPKKIAETDRYLKEQEELLKKIKGERMHGRFSGYFLYNQGVAHQNEQQYDKAAASFKQLLSTSEAIGWERGIIYAKKFLADIAIEKKSHLDEAQILLEEGWQLVESTNDKRWIALYKRSFAKLEQARNNPKAHDWAREALDDFQHLDMELEVQEMRQIMEE